jgi:hypothetical protein
MRIRITKQTSISGEVARVGDVVEVDAAVGQVLQRMGKAAEVTDEPAPEPPAPAPRKPRTRRK